MKVVMGFVAITVVVHYGLAKNHQTATMKAKTKGQLMDAWSVEGARVDSSYLKNLWPDMGNDENVIMLGEVLAEIENGRGKSHKYKKLSKTLYPLFMGVLIAKVVLIPLILKTLTAISSAALVMSKISLITTGLLALKWIFAGQGAEGQNSQFELIYVPPIYGKPQRSLRPWSDPVWAQSSLIEDATAGGQQKYIPINGVRSEFTTYGSSYGHSNMATSDSYQPSYKRDANYNEGKPFL